MKIQIKRIYDNPGQNDGCRILVDRLWPRGISKEKAKIDYWAKELAPSNELRRWYGHDPDKWPEFKSCYFTDLEANPGSVKKLLDYLSKGPVTFVYASKEQHFNNALALKEYFESRRN